MPYRWPPPKVPSKNAPKKFETQPGQIFFGAFVFLGTLSQKICLPLRKFFVIFVQIFLRKNICAKPVLFSKTGCRTDQMGLPGIDGKVKSPRKHAGA